MTTAKDMRDLNGGTQDIDSGESWVWEQQELQTKTLGKEDLLLLPCLVAI